jgi:hypothetical protein
LFCKSNEEKYNFFTARERIRQYELLSLEKDFQDAASNFIETYLDETSSFFLPALADSGKQPMNDLKDGRLDRKTFQECLIVIDAWLSSDPFEEFKASSLFTRYLQWKVCVFREPLVSVVSPNYSFRRTCELIPDA